MQNPRENAVCPYCRGPNPFTVTDVGMKISSEGMAWDSKAMRPVNSIKVTVSRRPWELEMMDHLRERHRTEWVRIMAELAEALMPKPFPARVHVGLAILAWIRDQATIPDSTVPGAGGGRVGTMLGLPVISEPSWHPGRWEVHTQDGQVERHQVGADTDHVVYIPGKGFLGVDQARLAEAARIERDLVQPTSWQAPRYADPVMHKLILNPPLPTTVRITGV